MLDIGMTPEMIEAGNYTLLHNSSSLVCWVFGWIWQWVRLTVVDPWLSCFCNAETNLNSVSRTEEQLLYIKPSLTELSNLGTKVPYAY